MSRITYLIANYNHARHLPDCVQSLLDQTDDQWLAVIRDDASTDDSREVMAQISDPRIRCEWNEQNLGYIETLERLIAGATTDIVAVLDADDALEPDATAELVAAWEKNPGAALVYSRFARYDADMRNKLGEYGRPIREGGTAMLQATVGAIRSFSRSAYAKTSGLDPAMRYAEDRDLVYKLEEVAPPVFIDRVLYRYRILADSHSHDPVKLEAGLRNTHRARRAALRRRKVSGLSRLLAEVAIAADYVDSSQRLPRFARALASRIGSAAATRWRLRTVALARAGGD
jgi:glycosyltransferase involved in cell wall biosynthesis